MRDITGTVLAHKAALKIRRRVSNIKKFTAGLAVALGVVGIALTSLASATTVTWNGNGTTNGFCTNTSTNSNITGQNWLFILSSPDGTGPYTLTAHFSPATTPDPIVVTGTQQGNGSIHFTVNTTVGAQLLSASATGGTDNSVLTVSDCVVGSGTSVTTTTLKDSSNNTVAQGASVPLGSVIHDTATVTLTPSAVPTGSVTFRFYTTASACTADTNFTGGTTMGSIALNGANPGVADPSNSTTALGPGTYAFKANWPGMTGYNGSTSSCETFTVTQAQLGISTTVHDVNHNPTTTFALGSSAHDSATVTGGVTGFALPDVTFYFFANGVSCTNGSTTGGTQLNTVTPDSNGVAHPSTSETNLAAGTYNFMAVVAGNTNYLGATSNCEPFTVNKATLGLTTTIHDAAHNAITSIDAGGTVHDQANVTGIVSGFTPTNSVSFTFFTGGNCTTGTPQSAGTAAIVSGVAHPSSSEGPLGAGSYAFQATYDGTNDPNYNSVTSSCEPLTVNKVTPNISTTPSPTTGTLGTVLNDSATVTGGFNPTGNVTFKLFGPSDPTCSGTPAYTFTDTSSPYATSPGFTSNAVGTWRWTATYNGDNNNNSVTSGCNDELVTVTGLFWCSPGFWATALKFNRTGVLNYLSTHSGGLDLNTFLYNNIPSNLKAPLSKKATNTSPTLAQVLASPNIYGGPAFNSVADYIAFRLGWGGTQNTGENCPLDAHGNFTGTLTLTTL